MGSFFLASRMLVNVAGSMHSKKLEQRDNFCGFRKNTIFRKNLTLLNLCFLVWDE